MSRPIPGQTCNARLLVRSLLLALAMVAITALAACGKKGPPEPPGPASDITYPRIYPTR